MMHTLVLSLPLPISGLLWLYISFNDPGLQVFSTYIKKNIDQLWDLLQVWHALMLFNALVSFNILVMGQIEQILPFIPIYFPTITLFSIFGSQFSLGQVLILRALVNHQKLNIFLEYNLFCSLARITNAPSLQEINKCFLCSCTLNTFKPAETDKISPTLPRLSELIPHSSLCLFSFTFGHADTVVVITGH